MMEPERNILAGGGTILLKSLGTGTARVSGALKRMQRLLECIAILLDFRLRISFTNMDLNLQLQAPQIPYRPPILLPLQLDLPHGRIIRSTCSPEVSPHDIRVELDLVSLWAGSITRIDHFPCYGIPNSKVICKFPRDSNRCDRLAILEHQRNLFNLE